MAIYNEGGCCGAPQLFVDTEGVGRHVQTIKRAHEEFGSIASSVDFAGAVGALGGSGIEHSLGDVGGLLQRVLQSHADRAGATHENIHNTVQQYVGQDEENASHVGSAVQ